jgi:O-antigen ligase
VALLGLTPNHKTLAVALAPWFPLLIGLRRSSEGRGRALWGVAAVLLSLAVLASASKTAWICLAFGGALVIPNSVDGWGWRPKLALPLLIGALAIALQAPAWLGSKALIDAARSRHSLNIRAVEMVRAHPVLGAGPGGNIAYEMVEFPHYRVNGVDAHGVVQKVASETGLVGLAAYASFAGLVLITAGRRRRLSAIHAGAAGTLVALHVNLLVSTEAFSPTHWFPFAVAWGLLQSGRRGERL